MAFGTSADFAETVPAESSDVCVCVCVCVCDDDGLTCERERSSGDRERRHGRREREVVLNCRVNRAGLAENRSTVTHTHHTHTHTHTHTSLTPYICWQFVSN